MADLSLIKKNQIEDYDFMFNRGMPFPINRKKRAMDLSKVEAPKAEKTGVLQKIKGWFK